MERTTCVLRTISIQIFFLLLVTVISIDHYAQCSKNLWQGRSISTMPNCTSGWLSADRYVRNGVLQMLANETCNPSYYYPDFEMIDSLCITPDFTYEVRLRNLNPAPVNLSAYDVYLRVLNTAGINTGVTLMDANPLYDWSQVYTNLFAGSASAGNLASLRPNLNNWTTVTLEYKNNTLTCLINGVVSAQVQYTGTICTISGLAVRFKGSGELDWARILNASGTEVWREDFYKAQTPGCFTPFPECQTVTLNPAFTGPSCSSNVLTLSANSTQPLSNITWTGPSGFTSTDQNPVINNPTAANNGIYTLTAQQANCGPMVTGSVTVNTSAVATIWEGRSQSPTNNCTSNWVNAGQYVNNGVMQMQANQTCNPLYYYPEFRMNDTLCVTGNFRYEARLRNLNPTPPLNLSAYDVNLQIFNTAGINTGVTLMDGNPNYDWSQIYTTLYAGPSTVGNLASLRPDLNNWTTVALDYSNNILTCFINGVQAAQLPYTGTICTISGLNIVFKGSGEVDWLRILDANGTEVWREDFNGQAAGCFIPFPGCSNNATLDPDYTGPTCSDNTLSLLANPGRPFSSYSWSGPGGFASTQENPVINNPTNAVSGVYTVTGQQAGCGPAVTGTVQVNFSAPSITSNIADVTIKEGDSIQLIAAGGALYNWSPNTNISNTNIADPFVWPYSTTEYIVTIIDGLCTELDTVLVKVLKPLVIPNIFSPNGDGVHDRWEINNLDLYKDCVVQIFNRYGQLVRRFVNYSSPWDGKIDGRDAPVATYYYIIDPKNGEKPIAGFVDIIR